jgi:hypothetical protein
VPGTGITIDLVKVELHMRRRLVDRENDPAGGDRNRWKRLHGEAEARREARRLAWWRLGEPGEEGERPHYAENGDLDRKAFVFHRLFDAKG